ncbi:uncharacterized protein LOC133804209 isoform X2 [Humulus lupulus]|nr:uncharacterized protein LOC133804209 isoform X2 [Humulus lupulus]
MLKQSTSRNQRSKGFKVKHALQICLLLAICIWLLYQVKHSHDKNKAFGDSSSMISTKMLNGLELIKVGRRDLHPQVDTQIEVEKLEENDFKEDLDETRLEENDNEEGRSVDDEIDEHDQERAEEEEPDEVEDLIDEEDGERHEGIEEQEIEDKEIDFEDAKSLEDLTENEGKSNGQEARDEHYKDDDASSAVMQNIQSISRSLRKVNEEKVGSVDKNEVEREIETYHTQDFIVGVKDSGNKVHRSLTAKTFASENAGEVSFIDSEFDSTHSDNTMYSTAAVKAESNKQTNLNSEIFLLLKEPTSVIGTNTLSELRSDLNLSSNGKNSYLGAVLGNMNEIPVATNLQTYSGLTLSAVEDYNAIEKGMELNGSESIVQEGILQFGKAAETEELYHSNH